MKYYISAYKNGEPVTTDGYDFTTTRKSEYKKFAKQAILEGAESVEVQAAYKDQCTGDEALSLVEVIYPEEVIKGWSYIDQELLEKHNVSVSDIITMAPEDKLQYYLQHRGMGEWTQQIIEAVETVYGIKLNKE